MRADALAAYVEYGFHDTSDSTVTLACAPESEAATFTNAGTSVEDISGLELRCTIAHGESLQEPSPAGFAKAAAQVLPSGTLAPYEGIGHFGPMEAPLRIANDVVTFLS